MAAVSVMYTKIFLDTAPIIYHLQQEERFGPFVEEFFRTNNEARFISTTITVSEYHVFVYRFGRPDLSWLFESFVKNMYIEIVSIDSLIAHEAACIRAKYTSIKLPDAMQLAAAIITGCDVLYTNDDQLKQFRELPVQTIAQQ